VLALIAITLLSIIIRASPADHTLDVLTRNPSRGLTAALTPPIAVLLGFTAVAALGSLAAARCR